MSTSITATEAARRFSDLLNRTRYRGESFTILRGGEPVGQLVPPPKPVATLATLLEIRARHPDLDEEFAEDLRKIRREQPPLPEDPWGC